MTAGHDGKRLAVVAVTHNSGHAIEAWIDALERTGRRDRMELCVVDSGSSPDERRILTERVAPRVDVLCERPNLGYGRACNVGAEQTSAPVLLFSNPDTRLVGVPPAVWEDGDLGGRVIGAHKQQEDGSVKPLGFGDLPTARYEVQELALGRWRRGIDRTVDPPAWVSGAAMLMSRADFERIGGFTDAIFMYFEDADLCARHRTAGGTVVLDPAFVVEHGAGRSTVVVDRDALASALDSINRLSARTFAARHGHAWHRPALYAPMVAAYLPRRVAVALLGRRGRPGRVGMFVMDLLRPGRALRRLGAGS